MDVPSHIPFCGRLNSASLLGYQVLVPKIYEFYFIWQIWFFWLIKLFCVIQVEAKEEGYVVTDTEIEVMCLKDGERGH